MEDSKIIITRTPLRITFTGGGSDIPSFWYKSEGHCISATIDKYVYVLVKKRFDDKIYLKYSENEVVDNVDDIKHDFIRETLKFMKVKGGIEVINWADIPTKGTGLGSSSSFLVGLLNALHTLNGDKPTKHQIANEACYIEVNLCSKPIGYQDQQAAAYGGFNQMIFKSTVNTGDRREVKRFAFTDHQLRDISNNLMLFYTGITRDSESVLTDQSNNIDNNKDTFRLMVENVELSKQFAEHLLQYKFDKIGEYLNRNWELKQNFSGKISNSEINALYKKGINAGAAGGKLLGAGGGGFIMFYVDHAFHKNVLDELKDYRYMPIEIDPYGSRVLLNTEEKMW